MTDQLYYTEVYIMMMDIKDMKLHLLILLTLVGIAFYLFLVFKELKMLESDIVKRDVQISLLEQDLKALRDAFENKPSEAVTTSVPKKSIPHKSVKINSQHAVIPTKTMENFVDEQDDDSIDSTEIKDILTRGSNFEEGALDDDVEFDEEGDVAFTSSIEPKKVVPNLFELTEVELLQLKYEDLRGFLRKHSVHTKGTKQELVAKIMELKVPSS